MEKVILSIIVPSYKTSIYMDANLPTFVSNRLKGKIEVLLIDDGSPDDSLNKAISFQSKYPEFFKAVHKDNGGHGSVINFGISISRGKYIKVVDGDDYVITESLESLVAFLETQDFDAVVSDFILSYPNKKKLVRGRRFKQDDLSDYVATIHSLTFKRRIFVQHDIRVREGIFYEDNEYATYPFEFVKSIGYFNKAVYVYSLGLPNQSVSYVSAKKHFPDAEIVFDDLLSFYKKLVCNNTKSEVRVLVATKIAVLFNSAARFFLSSDIPLKSVKSKLGNRYQSYKNYSDLIKACMEHKIIKILVKTKFNVISLFAIRTYLKLNSASTH